MMVWEVMLMVITWSESQLVSFKILTKFGSDPGQRVVVLLFSRIHILRCITVTHNVMIILGKDIPFQYFAIVRFYWFCSTAILNFGRHLGKLYFLDPLVKMKLLRCSPIFYLYCKQRYKDFKLFIDSVRPPS